LQIWQRAVMSLWFLGLGCLPVLPQRLKQTPAKKTAIDSPGALVLDNQGHLFVAQIYGDVVRRVDLRTNAMSTVAGNGKACCYRENTKAIEASLDFPRALAVDSSDNLFIAEGGSIRKVDMHTGLISTFTTHAAETKEGVPVESVSFQRITSLAIGSTGDLYVADDIQGRIFRVDGQSRNVSLVAGSGEQGFSGDGGPALRASFRFIESIALDGAGNLYVADGENCRIRRVDHRTGVIQTVAITSEAKEECPPPPGTNPLLPTPEDLAVGPDGNVYFVEPAMNVVVRLDKTNNLSIVAGTGGIGFSGDGGLATDAELSGPSGLAIDSSGNLFVSDCRNNRIRRVDARTKVISNTIAGDGFPHIIHAEE
jgi:sugar lactone lactonase YvrE